MPQTTSRFELVVNGEVCSVELAVQVKGEHPIYGVWFKGGYVGQVKRIKQNFWKAFHHESGKEFEGRVRQLCVTTMIVSEYKK